MASDKSEKNILNHSKSDISTPATKHGARPVWYATLEARPNIQINPNVYKRRLNKKDVTVKNAIRKIKSVDDLISYLLAVKKLMSLGGPANQARAERCLFLCLLHPDYTDLAHNLAAEMADEDGIIR